MYFRPVRSDRAVPSHAYTDHPCKPLFNCCESVSHSNHSMRKGRPCVCWEVKGAMWARGKSRSGKSLWDGQRVSTHALSRFVALRAPSAPCRAVLSTLKGLPDVLFQIAHTSNLQVHCCSFARTACTLCVCVMTSIPLAPHREGG